MQTIGNGIHQRVGQPGDGIGGAGAGGDQDHADLAGRARIAFRRMDRALLVADEDVLQAILLMQLVIDRQNGAARIAENMLDALIGESLEHHLGACHCTRHRHLIGKTRPRRKVRKAGPIVKG